MARVPQTSDELQKQLEDQLQFLKASADSFDQGFDAEAKRLAVSLRVLLHDTKNSKSLLGQLGRKSGNFLSTALPFNPESISTHGGLVCLSFGSLFVTYSAELDDAPAEDWLGLDDWWNTPVFRDMEKRVMSRGELVCAIANQDGGAHVDPAIDATYYALSRGNSLNWHRYDSDASQPMGDPSGVAIRQIAHEVLRTLEPTYRKKPSKKAKAVVAGMQVVVGKGAVPKPSAPKKKTARNARCPCGSPLKYKHCHGKHV